MNASTRMKQLSVAALLTLGLLSATTYADRKAPAEVPPVTHEGVTYSAPAFGVFQGRAGVNGQYIQAKDAKTDKLLWELRVYEVKRDPQLEGDVQDIFITSLKIAKGNLEVMNERGDKFVVDVTQHKVIEGANRVYQPPARPR